jgi:hypothetical protein
LPCSTSAKASRPKPTSQSGAPGRGDQKQLVGEFAYQIKVDKRDDLHRIARRRCEQFFVNLQYAAQEWLALGTTKTGAVYRLKGNPPNAHE